MDRRAVTCRRRGVVVSRGQSDEGTSSSVVGAGQAEHESGCRHSYTITISITYESGGVIGRRATGCGELGV
jgi:hypothetical protein